MDPESTILIPSYVFVSSHFCSSLSLCAYSAIYTTLPHTQLIHTSSLSWVLPQVRSAVPVWITLGRGLWPSSVGSWWQGAWCSVPSPLTSSSSSSLTGLSSVSEKLVNGLFSAEASLRFVWSTIRYRISLASVRTIIGSCLFTLWFCWKWIVFLTHHYIKILHS